MKKIVILVVFLVLSATGLSAKCGDSITEPGEVCDGSDLNGYNCASVAAGFVDGSLSCKTDCSSYDVSECELGNVIYVLNSSGQPSCEQADVQAAINLAESGDTVIIGAGNCTWTTFVDILYKGLVIMGAGIDRTVIKNDVLMAPYIFRIYSTGGRPFRVTGLTFTGGKSSYNDYYGAIYIEGSCKNWRVDNCKFYHLDRTAIKTWTWNYGVIDNCEFTTYRDPEGNPQPAISVSMPYFEGTLWGDGSFKADTEYGTADAVYIENCKFYDDTGASGHGHINFFEGARAVVRYNEFYGEGIVGQGTGALWRYRGFRSLEIYSNLFDVDTTPADIGGGIDIGGGTGVIFDNILRNGGIYLRLRRKTDFFYSFTWGMCDDIKDYWCTNPLQPPDYKCLCTTDDECDEGETCTQCCTDVFNGDTLMYCRDQPGRGKDLGISGLGEQALEPLYEWDNKMLYGNDVNFEVAQDIAGLVQKGRDYYDDTISPGYVQYVYPHPLVTSKSDSIPPFPFNGQPIGSLPSGTTSITLSLETDERAVCKYSPDTDLDYFSMPYTFSNTDSFYHSTILNDLQDGKTYDYYVKCSDVYGNYNIYYYLISFNIATINVFLVHPQNYYSSGSNDVSFNCFADSNSGEILGIQLYTNISGWKTEASGIDSLDYKISNIPNGTYVWNCLACEGDNCRWGDSNYTFTIDKAVPVILDMEISYSTDFAVITWETDEPASSVIEYGTESGIYSYRVSDSNYAINHSIYLSDLDNVTTYFFIINSTDVYGNSVQSPEYDFTTKDSGKMVLCLKFDEGSGDTAFDSSASHINVNIGGTTWTQGVNGSAVSFDGVDDYISVGDGWNVSRYIHERNYTLSLWIKSTATSPQQFVASFNGMGAPENIFMLGHQDDSNVIGLWVHALGDWQTGTTNVIDGEWHHIAYVFEDRGWYYGTNQTTTVYVDGRFEFNHSSYTRIAPTYLFSLGMEYDSSQPSDFYNGVIDEVKIYDKILSVEEIQDLYHEFDSNRPYHHIRSDAPAGGDGSDWNNAWTTLPDELIRGHTYYIADGTYGRFTIDDPEDGEKYIYIKKATENEHGSNVGWENDYGDGQAVFLVGPPPAVIKTSYVVFDGVRGEGSIGGLKGPGSNPDNYGFKLQSADCHYSSRLMDAPDYVDISVDFHGVTISHVAFTTCGKNATETGTIQTPFRSYPNSGDFTFTYNYIIGGTTNMRIHQWSKGSKIQYNYFDYNWVNVSAGNAGGQIHAGMDDDIIVSNNIFKNSTYATIIIYKSEGGIGKNWKIYNNLFVGGTCRIGRNNDEWDDWGEEDKYDILANWEVHHNTFVNCSSTSRYGVVVVGNLTDVEAMKSYVHNNLFYNVVNPRMDNVVYTEGAIVHTHNAYFNPMGVYDDDEGGTAQIGITDPFVDSANYNFHLAQPTNVGLTLPAPYDIDIDGNPRGADDNWDRGAYEYIGYPLKCSFMGGTCCNVNESCEGGSLGSSSDCGDFCCLSGSCALINPDINSSGVIDMSELIIWIGKWNNNKIALINLIDITERWLKGDNFI